MNKLIETLMGKLTADKGRDVNRTLVLLGVLWCAVQISDVKERVVIIETRLNHRVEATNEYGKVTIAQDYPGSFK